MEAWWLSPDACAQRDRSKENEANCFLWFVSTSHSRRKRGGLRKTLEPLARVKPVVGLCVASAPGVTLSLIMTSAQGRHSLFFQLTDSPCPKPRREGTMAGRPGSRSKVCVSAPGVVPEEVPGSGNVTFFIYMTPITFNIQTLWPCLQGPQVSCPTL